MVIFVDTSAIYAFLDKRDENHGAAAKLWDELTAEENRFVTTNYVLLETVTLLQRRLGAKAVRDVHERVAPIVDVHWIESTTHELAMRTVVLAGERGISLVDATSFEAMRERGLRTAFTFDRHFAYEGFDCIP